MPDAGGFKLTLGGLEGCFNRKNIFMRKIILLCLLLFVIKSDAQQIFQREKRDYEWVTGSISIEGYPNFGATMFDFSSDPPLVYQQFNPINFNMVNASICDTSGQYLFHTNGISIVNSYGEIIEGGERINPGNFTDDWVNLGVPLDQGGLVLPLPESDSIYYLFHETNDWSPNHPDGNSTSINYFYYSIINMASNEGSGKILEKNVPFIEGVHGGEEFSDLGYGKITAIRHSNGRDWWVMIPKYNRNQYYVMLFDSQGLHHPQLNMTGDTMSNGLGQAVFAPNGHFYSIISSKNISEGQFVSIYEFNRENGTLDNQRLITYNDTAYSAGVAFSENSRFLYVSSFLKIYQYDLEADDIEASKVIVAEYDPDFTSPPLNAKVKFFLAQLAPDGKIYISSYGQGKYYSVIHEPNKKGLACRAEPHGVELLTYNFRNIPNFPYYGLGPLDNSPADTLGINNPPPTARFEYVQDTMDAHEVAFFDATLFSPPATMYIVPEDAYQWTFGDGEGSHAQHPIHTYAEDGIYEVCLTATNYSGSDTWCDTLYVNVVGTEQPESPLKYAKLFPNPTSDYFYFDYLLPGDMQATARLYDIQGHLLKERRLKPGNVSQGWDITDLPNGVYFFIAESESGVLYREKVVKLQ